MIDHKGIARLKSIQADKKQKARASLPASNRKLADRLAEAKKKMDDAKAIYDILRDQVILHGGSIGDDYLATIQAVTTSRPDKKKLEARFGKAAVAECCNTSTSHRVDIKARRDVFG